MEKATADGRPLRVAMWETMCMLVDLLRETPTQAPTPEQTRTWVHGRDVLTREIQPLVAMSDLNSLDDWYWFMAGCYEEFRVRRTSMDRAAALREVLQWQREMREWE
jgi:hypothetical protein